MTLSRRMFIGSSLATIVAQNAWMARPVEAWPRHGVALGKAQVNLWFPYGTMDYPLINFVNSAGNGWRWDGTPTQDPFGLMDANGCPTAIPTGSTYWFKRLDLPLPSPGDTIVLTWTGAATVYLTSSTTGLNFSIASSSANRIVYNIDAGTSGKAVHDNINLDLNVSAVASNLSAPAVFFGSDEADKLAGKITRADFRSFYNMWGIIRFMDYLATNGNSHVAWSSRVTTNQASWVGVNVDANNYAGRATKSGNDFTCPNTVSGSPTSWTHGQVVECSFPANADMITFSTFTSNSNPCQINFPSAHGLVNGDIIMFSGLATSNSGNSFDSATDGNFYTVTVVNSTTITLSGLNATGMTDTGSGGARKIYKQIRVGTSTLPLKRVIRNDGGSPFSDDVGGRVIWSYSNAGWGGTWLHLTYDADFDALLLSYRRFDNLYSGFPHEAIAQIANELNVSPWVNIPHGASDDYVTQMATMYKANLNSNLVLNLEYSNEVWNSSFAQWGYATRKAKLVSGTADQDLYYGYRFYQMMGLVASVYGTQLSSRVHRVFGCRVFQTGTGANDNRFQAPGMGLGTGVYPISRADSLAVAPYYEANNRQVLNQYVWQAVYGNSTQKQAAITYFDGLLRDVSGTDSSGFPTVYRMAHTLNPYWAGLAASPAPGVGAIKYRWYEAGVGQFITGYTITPSSSYDPGTGAVVLTSTDTYNALALYRASPEFAATLTQYLSDFVSAGGDVPSQYTLVDNGTGNFAPWGMVYPNIYGTQTPAYSSLRTFNGR